MAHIDSQKLKKDVKNKMEFRCEISGKPQMMMNVKTISKTNLHEHELKGRREQKFCPV